MYNKVCPECNIDKDIEEFSLRKSGYRYYCCKECKRINDREYTKRNLEKNRNRAKEWYIKNKEKALKRIKNYYRSDYGKSIRKKQREIYNKNNPEWWSWKKKHDKSSRLGREKIAGPLDLSSIIVLEEYNKNLSGSSTFICEYCNSYIIDSYHLDHIVPISKSGTNKLVNLAITCQKCNLHKAGKLLEEIYPSKVEYIKNRNLFL